MILKKNKNRTVIKFGMLLLASIVLVTSNKLVAQEKAQAILDDQTEAEILQLMEEGDIPGLSVILIDGNKEEVKSFGYANVESQQPVISRTQFEIGSLSKAFTALAITNLEKQGKINLDLNVSDYIPWFHTTFNDSEVSITVRQLLHHTSGIPWETISKIPETNDVNALEQTIRILVGQELDKLPGSEYQYATINYDVLALIIAKVSGQSFEAYLEANIFNKLGLETTSIGKEDSKLQMATGYKIGFFEARPYQAPTYKGNNAAGYVISNAEDMMRWIKFQMGEIDSDLYEDANVTHQRDETVALHSMSSYARGWQISLDGTEEIYHDGLNPNFSSYITFRKNEKVGVVVMANSNSNMTSVIGNKLIKYLANEKIEKIPDPGDGGDRTYSGISIAILFYIVLVIGFLLLIVWDLVKKRRKFEGFGWKKLFKFILSLLVIAPFLYAIYILPVAISDFTWDAILVWTPVSFSYLLIFLVAAIAISYFAKLIAVLFPDNNSFKQKAPAILLMTTLSGIANVLVIVMVTSVIDSEIEIKYLSFYYLLVIAVYLVGRRFVQVNLIKIARGLVYDLRIKLVDKIFSTSYEKFEGLDRGRIYTALNDDVNTIGGSIGEIILLVTSFITAVGAFVYLASLAFWATIFAIILIIGISSIYYLVGQKANTYFEEARDSRNGFMRLINGMIDGYKEISLHRRKKLEYKKDIENSAFEYKDKMSTADIKFTNAFLVGESLLIILLGFVVIAMSQVFPSIRSYTIMNFVIVFLYLIGPVNAILNTIPDILNLRIAWDRVQKFINEIPANLDLSKVPASITANSYKLEAKGIEYRYKSGEEDDKGFCVGPIDLEIKSGEVFFIIGGNGSGKTTLAKMLTGLYKPDKGEVLINGEVQDNFELSEYFSTVFNPSHLFEKLYSIDVESKQKEIVKYLELLDLQNKVEIKDKTYSTISLSGGQRKRLALLQCYLEDSPIFLFDEWAADQDPEYRHFFYRTLLPDMRRLGKLVIAITHDDHYFDVADKILKLDQGQLDFIEMSEAVVSK
jgi:putative ATP-binding cassette transporter